MILIAIVYGLLTFIIDYVILITLKQTTESYKMTTKNVNAELLLNAFVDGHELSWVNISGELGDFGRIFTKNKSLNSAKKLLESIGFNVLTIAYHPFSVTK